MRGPPSATYPMLSTTSGLAWRSPNQRLSSLTVRRVWRASLPACNVTGIWNCRRSDLGRKSYGMDTSTVTATASIAVIAPMNSSLCCSTRSITRR